MSLSARRMGLIALIIVAASGIAAAWVDVKVEHDKTFDFKSAKTWAWDPDEVGTVHMARSPMDDPDAMRARIEPIVLDAVATEMKKRGAALASGTPDLTLKYHLLLTTTSNAQTMGQFLPATTAWGLPPFPPATQALTGMNQGSLVLDMKSKGTVVWRGVANAKIKIGIEEHKREAVLRESIRDLLKRFPPR